ncbi:MAG: acetyltransferase-like isoleucine patch superfamily enzyme [Halioglobus sp.]|jgi:acetyltransferase-like isoleucine patch superfamily enzyme
MSNITNRISWYASQIVEIPSYIYHFLFSWMYSTHNLRTKAAVTPFMRVRILLLHRSGISIGAKVYIHQGVLVVGTSRKPPAVSIGKRVDIGPSVTFVTSSMPSFSRLLHHPEVQSAIVVKGCITVEDDVWIGAGVVILPNVTIGKNSLIGSGAVVTKSIPPFSVAMGTPARVTRTLTENT